MTSYTEGERITSEAARLLTETWPAPEVVFYDDLGGGSEAIRCVRLPDGRFLVHCTGTGNWLLPADAPAVEVCEREAHGCYVAAGFDSPYED